MAIDSGAPAAFYRYAAPDGITFAGTGELNVGPAAIRARLAEGAAGKAKWVWRPVLTVAAASGDLGVTIGTAEIDFGSKPADVFLSKYLTVWKRQPDGSIKFVADGGSGRPGEWTRQISENCVIRLARGPALPPLRIQSGI